jgi:prostatic aicd phosphatase
MNVQFIHNAKFAAALPKNYLAIARDLANFHEYGVFSDPKPSGIGNSTFKVHSGPTTPPLTNIPA